MESIKKTVGENLRKICKVKDVKNKQIAEALNVSESSVSNWLKGKNSFDIDNLYAICKYLGVSVDQVFGVDPIVFGVLNPEENDILVAYRKAGEGIKEGVRKLLDVEIKKDSTETAI